MIIRQAATIVHSRNTDLIGIGTTKSYKSFEKLELTQFAHLWVG